MWPALYTTFPAGGYRLTKNSAVTLKRHGMMPGMPDLLVFFDKRTIGLELKSTQGRVSKAQKEAFYKLRDAGVPVYFCRSQEDVVQALQNEKVPMRRMHGLYPPKDARFRQQEVTA